MIVDVAPYPVGGWLLSQTDRNQVANVPSACLYSQLVVATSVRQQPAYIVVDPLGRLWCKCLFSKVCVGLDQNGFQCIVDLDALQVGCRTNNLPCRAIGPEVII